MDTMDNALQTEGVEIYGLAKVNIWVGQNILRPGWYYRWSVWIVGEMTHEHLNHDAPDRATAYRLACECAAAEARARLGTEAAVPIVDALNTFLWQKTQLSLFELCVTN